MKNCTFYKFNIDNNSITELNEIIKSIGHSDFTEIYILELDKSSLTILTNKNDNKAFVMFQDMISEKFYTPTNLAETSEDSTYFTLSNGQLDSYPNKKLVDIETARKIILSFNEKRAMWNGVVWKED